MRPRPEPAGCQGLGACCWAYSVARILLCALRVRVTPLLLFPFRWSPFLSWRPLGPIPSQPACQAACKLLACVYAAAQFFPVSLCRLRFCEQSVTRYSSLPYPRCQLWPQGRLPFQEPPRARQVSINAHCRPSPAPTPLLATWCWVPLYSCRVAHPRAGLYPGAPPCSIDHPSAATSVYMCSELALRSSMAQ